MRDPLLALCERLLRAGVRPSAVSRYIAELRDHCDDIVVELMAQGVDDKTAGRIAMARLGGVEVLARPMLADPGARSWIARFPWLVFLICPVLVHTVLLAGLLLVLAQIAMSTRFSLWIGKAGVFADFLLVYFQPLTAIAVFALLGWRQRAWFAWPLAGGAMAVLASSALRLRVVLPAPGQGGSLIVATTLPYEMRVAILMGVVLAVGLLLRWLTAQSRGDAAMIRQD